MNVLEVFSENLLFLPSTFSVVGLQLASQCPDITSFSAPDQVTFWLQRLSLPHWNHLPQILVDCQAGIVIDRKSHICFCIFCCPKKSNSISKIILFFPKYFISLSRLRTRGFLTIQHGDSESPSFLSFFLFFLFSFFPSFLPSACLPAYLCPFFFFAPIVMFKYLKMAYRW